MSLIIFNNSSVLCALVLMHSTYGKQETANALRGIIAILRERGFTFGVVTPMTPQPL